MCTLYTPNITTKRFVHTMFVFILLFCFIFSLAHTHRSAITTITRNILKKEKKETNKFQTISVNFMILLFCSFILLPFSCGFFSLLSLENRFSFHSYWSRAVKMTLLIWFQRNRLSSHIISTNPNLSDEQIEWQRPRSNR